MVPFAVVGSEKNIVVNGKHVRGRQNRWGIINGMFLPCLVPALTESESPPPQRRVYTRYHTADLVKQHCTVEDENHCEFVYLRNFLTRTHLQDLIETTSQIHYEAFRSRQLVALKDSTQQGGSRPISPAADRELSRQSQRMTMNGYGP